MSQELELHLARLPAPCPQPRVTPQQAAHTQSVTKGIWFVFTLPILAMKLPKPGLHTFPEDDLSLLTKLTDQRPYLHSPEQPVQCR